MLAQNRQSVIKLTPLLRENNENNEADRQTFKYVNSTAFPPAPPQYEEGTWQNEQQGPLDMQVKPTSNYLARNERSTWKFPQPTLSSRDYKSSIETLIKDCNAYQATYRRTSHEYTTVFSNSSSTHISTRKPSRAEWEVRTDEQGKKSQEVTKETMETNPVMPFTIKEEFKIMGLIVKI